MLFKSKIYMLSFTKFKISLQDLLSFTMPNIHQKRYLKSTFKFYLYLIHSELLNLIIKIQFTGNNLQYFKNINITHFSHPFKKMKIHRNKNKLDFIA